MKGGERDKGARHAKSGALNAAWRKKEKQETTAPKWNENDRLGWGHGTECLTRYFVAFLQSPEPLSFIF